MNGHQPLFIAGYAGMAKGEEANGPTATSGNTKVEEDDHLLHLLGYQLCQHIPQGRHQAGGQDKAVT